MAGLLILSALFSGSETAFFSLPRARIRRMRSHGSALSAIVVRLVSSPRRLLVSVLLGNLAVNIGYFSVVLQLSGRARRDGHDFLSIAISVAAVLLLIFLGEFLPKGIALARPVRFARTAAVPLAIFDLAILPLRVVLDAFVKGLSRLVGAPDEGGPTMTADELKAFVRLSGAAGRIDADEREMLEDVIDFGEIRVKEVMVPRVDMVAADLAEGRGAIRELAQKHHVSKIVVFDGSVDRVVGYVAVKDLLYRPDASLREMVRDIVAVPETKTVGSLLEEFREFLCG